MTARELFQELAWVLKGRCVQRKEAGPAARGEAGGHRDQHEQRQDAEPQVGEPEPWDFRNAARWALEHTEPDHACCSGTCALGGVGARGLPAVRGTLAAVGAACRRVGTRACRAWRRTGRWHWPRGGASALSVALGWPQRGAHPRASGSGLQWGCSQAVSLVFKATDTILGLK